MGFWSKLFNGKVTEQSDTNTVTSTSTWSASTPSSPDAYVKIGEVGDEDDYDIYVKPHKHVDAVDITFKVCKHSTYDIYGNKIGEMNAMETVDNNVITSASFVHGVLGNDIMTANEKHQTSGHAYFKF